VSRLINLSQSFAIGGYMLSRLEVDAIILGFYPDMQLARVRAGFVPPTRRHVFERIKPLHRFLYFLW
jgi:bifunctional non-homologous end joining protein LigD